MQLAFLIALAAQFIWAVSSYLDRHLVEKRLSGAAAGVLMLYTSSLAAVVAPTIAWLHPEAMHVSALAAATTVVSGIFTYFGLVIYLYAIKREEAATVVPLFQITPVLVLAMSSFMPSERVTALQAIGALVVVGGAMALSMERGGERARLKVGLLKMVLAASALYAVSAVMFKLTAIETDFWTSCLWYYAGLALAGVITAAVAPRYSRDFSASLRRGSLATLGLTGLNEIINLGAEFLYHFAMTLAPLGFIAASSGLRPVIMLLVGVTMAALFPGFVSDRLGWRDLRAKLAPIAVICTGAVMVNWR
jgi:drug/metabolite transporter (DMT)-like permease